MCGADTCTHFHMFRGHRGTVIVREEGRGGRGGRGDGEFGSQWVRGGLGREMADMALCGVTMFGE